MEIRPRRFLPRLGVVDDPVVVVPPEVLARYNARILDPATAARVADQPAPRSTVYIADKLLVSGATRSEARDALALAADELDLEFEPPVAHVERRAQLVEAARMAGREDADSLFSTLHELKPKAGLSATPDAWAVLQAYRAKPEVRSDDRRHVSLDHLLTACKHITPGPFDPPDGGARVAGSYGEPGWGGRQPVNWLGGPPNRREDLRSRRPVVAVLDTGVGEHDWFPLDPETVVHRNLDFFGASIGLGEPSMTERTGVIKHPLEGVLDAYSGHGTFIAGLIHQQCPDADILSVRVMPSEGAVPEHVLHEALVLLLCRQLLAQANGDAGQLIDIVSLSLGYYPEHAPDAANPPFLYDVIEALGRAGVIVVVSAGNDATTRPMLPAAFTPHAGGWVTAADPDCVPVISVGANNPDGSIAMFSNAGPWVTCTESGAALVSTFPKFHAAGQAAFGFEGPDGWRSTIDPDNFDAGFGVWSGTSFAAPVFAGKLAAALLDPKIGSTDDMELSACVQRGWAAVGAHTTMSP